MNEDDDLLGHYDFDYSKAKPNRFAEELSGDVLFVPLDPDVTVVFPTSESTNDARPQLKPPADTKRTG
jgi:hypothetical protein